MSRGQGQTPAAAARQVEALTNPTLARFLLAELAEHQGRVEAEANGSLLVAPRMNVVAQFRHQLAELHGLEQPAPVRAPGPSGDHTPGGPA